MWCRGVVQVAGDVGGAGLLLEVVEEVGPVVWGFVIVLVLVLPGGLVGGLGADGVQEGLVCRGVEYAAQAPELSGAVRRRRKRLFIWWLVGVEQVGYDLL